MDLLGARRVRGSSVRGGDAQDGGLYAPRSQRVLRDVRRLSIYLLSLATKSIPVGTAYAVWVGIGAIGTAAYGMLVLGEDRSALRILCFVLILAGIVGLKLLSTDTKA